LIRFWDTSALTKLSHRAEPGHGQAVSLRDEAEDRSIRHITSMLVVVELASVLTRRTGRRGPATAALEQLAGFEQVEFTAQHRDLAVRLALGGIARGADTAIAAQAIIVAADAEASTEFITSDVAQGKLVQAEGKRRGVAIKTVLLPA
jgi:predicted nucleic acid-binding protein